MYQLSGQLWSIQLRVRLQVRVAGDRVHETRPAAHEGAIWAWKGSKHDGSFFDQTWVTVSKRP